MSRDASTKPQAPPPAAAPAVPRSEAQALLERTIALRDQLQLSAQALQAAVQTMYAEKLAAPVRPRLQHAFARQVEGFFPTMLHVIGEAEVAAKAVTEAALRLNQVGIETSGDTSTP